MVNDCIDDSKTRMTKTMNTIMEMIMNITMTMMVMTIAMVMILMVMLITMIVTVIMMMKIMILMVIDMCEIAIVENKNSYIKNYTQLFEIDLKAIIVTI